VRAPKSSHGIVSLAPSITELVFALDAGDRLVGATTACDAPEAARKIPRVGDFGGAVYEAILQLNPALVLGVEGAADAAMLTKLNEMGVSAHALRVGTLEEIRAAVQELGALLGVPDRARSVSKALQADLERVRDALGEREPVRTLLVLGARPLHVVSPRSFAGELLEVAGALNVVSAEGPEYPTWSLEQVVAARPEVILLSRMSGAAPALFQGWSSLPAVQNDRVHVLSSDDAILRPGPRMGEGAEALARLLHPSAFESRESR
jgi:iron complex transport system substrate-binding protein